MGYLILENGYKISGQFCGGRPQAGEVVFNTSHSGYEEMATDPSYFSQILVATAPQQGNYGVDSNVWESQKIWINGFICLEIQNSKRDSTWLKRLTENGVPVLTGLDTRALTLHLREKGTTWGVVSDAISEKAAQDQAAQLLKATHNLRNGQDRDWTRLVACQAAYDITGDRATGPKIAVLDFGAKTNILRELKKRTSLLRVFPPQTRADEILNWQPDGIMLTNGPGDPADVHVGRETVKQLLGQKFIFGICMGHQVLALALGAKTYKLKFGHRGSNHPIRDHLLGRVYVTSQNHGYNVDPDSLPSGAQVTHINLNDNTLAGFYHQELKCMSVQFHPESHPGPHDAAQLFDFFVDRVL